MKLEFKCELSMKKSRQKSSSHSLTYVNLTTWIWSRNLETLEGLSVRLSLSKTRKTPCVAQSFWRVPGLSKAEPKMALIFPAFCNFVTCGFRLLS